jgi:hypothetical protein
MKDHFSPKGFVQDLLVGLIILVISTFLGYWVNNLYSEPFIELDDNNGVYGVVNGEPVGFVFIGNSGYKTDKNISIKIDDSIDDKDVSIPGLLSGYTVTSVSDGTVITINELRPTEGAKIFFTPKDKTVQYFEILDVLSESNNINNVYYVGKWSIAFEIKVIVGFVIIVAFFLGWYVPKRIVFYRGTKLVGR